jgi:hypothetical protein
MVIPRNLNLNFRFQIRPVTARDFPVTAVTGNPDPPSGFFFLSGTKILVGPHHASPLLFLTLSHAFLSLPTFLSSPQANNRLKVLFYYLSP